MLSIELGLNLSPQDTELVRQQAPKIAARLQTDYLPREVKPVTFGFVVDRILDGSFSLLGPRTQKLIDIRIATGLSLQALTKEAKVGSRAAVGDIFKRGMKRLLGSLPEEVQTQLIEQRVFDIGISHHSQSQETREAIGRASRDRWSTEGFLTKINRARTRVKRSRSVRLRWQEDSGYGARIRKATKDKWDDPSYSTAVQHAIELKWKDPNYQERVKKGIKILWDRDPEYREKIAAASSKNKQSEVK